MLRRAYAVDSNKSINVPAELGTAYHETSFQRDNRKQKEARSTFIPMGRPWAETAENEEADRM